MFFTSYLHMDMNKSILWERLLSAIDKMMIELQKSAFVSTTFDKIRDIFFTVVWGDMRIFSTTNCKICNIMEGEGDMSIHQRAAEKAYN